MGQKVNPIGLRLGINRTWDSRWVAKKDYWRLLHEDFKIREYLVSKLKQAAISKIIIERPAKKARINIYSAKPGVIIGKKGSGVTDIKSKLSAITNSEISINIVEVKRPEIDSVIVAEGIAFQLEKRVSFRRAMKRAVQSSLRMGGLGVRISCSGRLGGAEIARMEQYREGRVPLHTFRSDIDYGFAEAKTAYGIIGIKVWIYKGDIMTLDPFAQDKKSREYLSGNTEGESTERGSRERESRYRR